jgi:N-acetylmuramoyl-L-alanine amidase
MKPILKTSVLTFTFCFLFLIVPLFPEKHHVAKVLPVQIENRFSMKTLPPLPINKMKFNSSQKKELECLAKNMYHEAKGEGGLGWLAVGMVTINRAQSNRYPNKICDVVYQNNGKVYQFSWAGTKKKLTKPKKELYNEIYQLAVLIFLHHQHMHDVTDNALFFHADYVDPYWNKKMKKTAKIGRHIFYKL